MKRHLHPIRNPQTQRADFRNSLESIGEYMALQILEELPSEPKSIRTLTNEEASHSLPCEEPVLVTILKTVFFAMARNEKTLKADTSYIAFPDIKDKYVILSDTMLGTGGSIIDALTILYSKGPKKIYVLVAIASQTEIDGVKGKFPEAALFPAAVDPKLNDKGYIVPGLGDAGDRCYG